MKWYRFDQTEMPKDETFLLALGEEIFFAKIFDKKIVTKYAFHDVDKINFDKIGRSGADIEVFEHNCARRAIAPLWAYFHKPESFK